MASNESQVSATAGPGQFSQYSQTQPLKLSEQANDDLYTIHEIHSHFWGKGAVYDDRHGATLHASAENPKILSWVLLFNAANPKWDENGVIFVKSNLDLLPAIKAPSLPNTSINGTATAPNPDGPVTGEIKTQENGTASAANQLNEGFPEDHPPIAIFTQPIRRANRSFKFLGWYKINRLQLLEPGSEELIRMLTKKWETVDRFGRVVPRQRDPKKWEESMSNKWAVIKMERDEEAERERGRPKIEKIDEEGKDGEN